MKLCLPNQQARQGLPTRMSPGHSARPDCYDSSGDQAGSEAIPGVGTRCSLRPEISTVNSEGPPLPPGSRKNIKTRPLGAKVCPSLSNPLVRIRSPEPSGFMMPMDNFPLPCLAKSMYSPRADHAGVDYLQPA